MKWWEEMIATSPSVSKDFISLFTFIAYQDTVAEGQSVFVAVLVVV